MNILVIGDMHNDVENVLKYIDKVTLLEFDVIVINGDFTDYNLPRGFSEEEMGKLIIEEFKGLGKQMVAVPGNFDKKLISLLEKEKISIHGIGIDFKGVGFYGYGGAKTPFDTPLEVGEDELKTGLEASFKRLKSKTKVQVTHTPPAGTKLDVISSGAHVGSEVVRKFIEEKKPVVAISAHIHEARGVDTIGSTKLINAGRFPEGYCGLVTINEEEVVTKIINLI